MKLHAFLLALLLLPLVGCANMSRNDSYAQDKTVTLDEWTQWANAITNAIVVAPSIVQEAKPLILAIGDFTNNSNRMDVAQDKDVFLGTLQKKLTNSGQIQVTRLLAGNAGRTDTVTKLSGELADDTVNFKPDTVKELKGNAKGPKFALSMMYNRKRTVDNRGNDVYENYFSIEIINLESKTAIYADDIYLDKKEGAFRRPGS